MYGILKEKNEVIAPEVVEFTQSLIRTPSPSRSEQAVAGLVENQMRDAGYDKVFHDEVGNVVGVMLGREQAPNVVLVSHMDTVDADDKWTRNPLDPQVHNGRLFGLGAADCKGNLAAQLYAGALLKRSMLPFRGNLVVAAAVAEDNGCSLGVKHLIEHTLPELDLTPTYVVMGEPTNLGLYYGHDGWAELEIRVEGSNPFHVDDAAKAISDDLGGRSGSRDDGDLHVSQTSFSDDDGVRNAVIPLTTRLRTDEQISDVMAHVKHQANLVTASMGNVAVQVAVRQEQQKTYTGVTTAVRKIVHAWASAPFHPLMERSRHALTAAGLQANPGKWRLGRLGMGTAGSVLVNDYKLPTIGYGPGEEELAHRPDESIQLEKLSQAVYGTAAIVHSLVGIPVFGWTTDEI
jgi:acetylornithine deacetylase/succinyl-diaminopimelate desuccinylase-like protein